MNKVELKNFIVYCTWCGKDAQVTVEDKRVKLFCTNSDCINNKSEFINIQSVGGELQEE